MSSEQELDRYNTDAMVSLDNVSGPDAQVTNYFGNPTLHCKGENSPVGQNNAIRFMSLQRH